MSQEAELMEKLFADVRRTKENIELSQKFSAELDKKREVTFGEIMLWLLSVANAVSSGYDAYQDLKQIAATAQHQPKTTPQLSTSFIFGRSEPQLSLTFGWPRLN